MAEAAPSIYSKDGLTASELRQRKIGEAAALYKAFLVTFLLGVAFLVVGAAIASAFPLSSVFILGAGKTVTLMAGGGILDYSALAFGAGLTLYAASLGFITWSGIVENQAKQIRG